MRLISWLKKRIATWENKWESNRRYLKCLADWHKEDKEDYDAWCKAGCPSMWGNTIAPGETKGIYIGSCAPEYKIENCTLKHLDKLPHR